MTSSLSGTSSVSPGTANTPRVATLPAPDGDGEIVLLSDSRVSAIGVEESDEPLVVLDESFGPAGALVREGVARRLLRAQGMLPDGLRLEVVEGHRHPADQQRIIDTYAAEVRAEHPGIDADQLEVLTSRFVSPIAVAPHVAGAATDLTLADANGPLDMGTPIDATPEQSGGRCYFGAPDISPEARALRDVLAHALGSAGLVNYPTEWWHWSYGDRYWALVTGAPAAVYGPAAPPS
ncbi:M15 family metallopeptidase [Promicromonospora thailandica]|uniref:D-alanyl-D-alanine dipeptidase n=1 Tax=Promicromonospora thailandica TaxID=765201 RepID=A0A9X2G2N4_9MICO|nr:M15 family metallopeptidase [Promicromonospora thailandica]MCP2264358.1 D-alanyl-D-alanine dipeptidase [Promicromonospora thailandica]BFF20950.1 M15 family metallopeptidase [Promicromonospora thailandica]